MELPRTLPEGSQILPEVRNAIAVASAKGGVGKSTVCINLALTMARRGVSVGLLDADIYGPSLQLLTGTREAPAMTADDLIQPVVTRGIRTMSMGYLTGEDTPVVWRGPLLAQAVQQFLSQVDWGELDVLFIDLPPGTGDIPLTLSQTVALSGAVIVTTPQDVALQDVARGIAMFQRVEVEVLGLVENMSYFLCPNCSERHEIFGAGGGRAMAEALHLPFLGELPLDGSIRAGGDSGSPVAASEGSPQAAAFEDVADRMIESLHNIWDD
ncbi:Mrp/NBP35 family ATP-binding protein [Candidatus Latescibacterota bacterium]